MTCPSPKFVSRDFYRAADRFLSRRWIQAILFTLTLLIVWLSGARAAHSSTHSSLTCEAFLYPEQDFPALPDPLETVDDGALPQDLTNHRLLRHH